ncbi:hypothetical protein DSO57_1037298 [Entomophthora muscae]|uniref:Uncharacterized protein n=1 Tax=Entomophthora muscae TaxID=34485 RepID=A0ACC2RDP5_9FUNG|nr:hypothetical protein DSO57_1037298 [Entomophthora muscae]
MSRFTTLLVLSDVSYLVLKQRMALGATDTGEDDEKSSKLNLARYPFCDPQH